MQPLNPFAQRRDGCHRGSLSTCHVGPMRRLQRCLSSCHELVALPALANGLSVNRKAQFSWHLRQVEWQMDVIVSTLSSGASRDGNHWMAKDCLMRIGIDARYLSHGLMGGVPPTCACSCPRSSSAPAQRRSFSMPTRRLRSKSTRPRCRKTLHCASCPTNPLSAVWRHDAGAPWRRTTSDVAHFPANFGFAPRRCVP